MNKLQPLCWRSFRSSTANNNINSDSAACLNQELPVVWQVSRTDDLGALNADEILNGEEKSRAGRLRVVADKQRFVNGRVALRSLLGQYVGIPPNRVQLQFGPYGKPSLSDAEGRQTVNFNVAHSGDLILLAFHASQEIGVDVEQIVNHSTLDEIVRQLFSTADLKTWNELPHGMRQQHFYQKWTQREAGLKALGCGLGAEIPDGWDSELSFWEIDLPTDYAGFIACRH